MTNLRVIPGQAADWRKDLITKMVVRAGGIVERQTLALPANVTTILRFHESWRGVIAYDEFAETIVKRVSPRWHSIDWTDTADAPEWSDIDTDRLVNWLSREEGVNFTAAAVESGLRVAANAVRVHPVRDYLRGLVWDKVPRLETMLSTYFGTDDTPYARGVAPRWMISAVARILKPGCQADLTLLLEGAQGTGKTSGFRELVPVPGWYQDTGLNLESKDSLSALRHVWIYGLDELSSLKGGEITRWKNFLTSVRDRYRPPYARREREFLRQNVFCGTTNESVYLADRSGNRRYVPFKVIRSVEIAKIREDRDQLWAEAVSLYRGGSAWHIDQAELRGLCETEQGERVHSDPWDPIVMAWLSDPVIESETGTTNYDMSHGVLVHEILLYALKGRPADMTKADEMRVAEILRSHGYIRGLRRVENGVRVRRYTLEEVVQTDVVQ